MIVGAPKRVLYTYEDIDRMVRAYQAGDMDAAGELFKAFGGFIAKYANFLKFGVMGPRDRDIHRLVRMLCPKGDNVNKRLALIRETLRSYEYEDIIGELNILFLESVHKFEPKVSKISGSVPFPGYLYAYFKFRVKRWIDKKLVDIMNTVKVVELSEEEREMQMLEDTQAFEKHFSKARPVLDSVTRWILHLYYHKGLQDRQIGSLVKVSGNWICGQRRAAIRKLRELGIDRVEDAIRGRDLQP